MANNYIIKTSDNESFCGWNSLGQIVMNGADRDFLTYAMSRTLAERTIPKIEAFTGKKCVVVKVS
jgi:hypothetical protein